MCRPSLFHNDSVLRLPTDGETNFYLWNQSTIITKETTVTPPTSYWEPTLFFWGTYYGTSLFLVALQFFYSQCYSDYVVKKRYPFSWKDILYIYSVVTFNAILSVFVLSFIWWAPESYSASRLNEDINDTEILSLMKTIAIWIISFIMSMTWFHYTHYLFHVNKYLYQNIHYLHHSYTPPCAAQALFVHPLELLVVFLPSAFMGPFLFRMTSVQFNIWNVILSIQGVLSHSGLNLSCSKCKSIPFLNATRHDLHHRRLYGNYGPIKMLDTFHNTEFVQ
jgi:Fatty acid hydroxylase superfamily